MIRFTEAEFKQLSIRGSRVNRAHDPNKFSEHELMNWCISYLSLRGHYVQRINSGQVFVDDKVRGKRTIKLAQKGTPDICGHTKEGRALYIEVKVHPNKPEPAQEEFLRLAKECGCIAEVVYTQEEMMAVEGI